MLYTNIQYTAIYLHDNKIKRSYYKTLTIPLLFNKLLLTMSTTSQTPIEIQTDELTQAQTNKDTRAKKYQRASNAESSTSYDTTNQTLLPPSQHYEKNTEKKSGNSTPIFTVTQNTPPYSEKTTNPSHVPIIEQRYTNKTNQKDYSLIEPSDTVGAVVGDWIVQRELADPQRLNPITVQDASGQEFSLYHRI